MTLPWIEQFRALTRREATPGGRGDDSAATLRGQISAATPDRGFWAFSLDLYGRPGVEEACLRMQDRDGLDVNMVLFAAWAGGSRGALPDEAMRAAVGFAGHWGGRVVQPLRDARRALKSMSRIAAEGDVEALRQRVKAVELEAERLQQTALAPLIDAADGAPGRSAAEANLASYLCARGLGPNHATASDVQILLTATFGPGGALEGGAGRAGA